MSDKRAGITIAGLTKHYGPVVALDGLDLALPTGGIVGLMGDNGAGKTTLLKILAGVLADWTGTIDVLGCEIGPTTKAFTSFLPDVDYLPDRYRLHDAVALFADFFADFDAARAQALIAGFGLPAARSLKEFSLGMREKLQIALTMSRRARVYLLDEPISGVDPAARSVIMENIINNYDADALLVMSTHLIADIEPVVDHVVFLRDGRVLLQGLADDLRAASGLSIDKLFRQTYRQAGPAPVFPMMTSNDGK
ncbi:MAG: ABC transporter ATP-binding protein [Actinomycetia bacterium]|nr:ABC transporter ATP-binding protein [Actinomycetes bacterium]